MIRFSKLFGAVAFVLSAFTVTQAHAVLPVSEPAFFKKALAGIEDYRLGDEWGKRPIVASDLSTRTPVFRRAAYAAARVGGGTGFYLGQFNGFHVVATNHHVCPNGMTCLNRDVEFPLLGLRARTIKFFGTWTDIDLALLAIRLDTTQAQTLAAVAKNFSFDRNVHIGQRLLTAGFGVAGNQNRRLVVNEDSDCKVFSDEYRFMADPDELNPGPYRAWSFANGCDVSHGDSGSAMVDRNTGDVMGIIWTGRIPKDASVQNSAFLDELLRRQTESIWQELSYAVPAAKIGEFLLNLAQNSSIPDETKQTLLRLLGR